MKVYYKYIELPLGGYAVKITNRKNVFNAKFYRNKDIGKLINTESFRDITDRTLDSLDFIRSYKGKIIKENAKPWFNKLAEYLVNEQCKDFDYPKFSEYLRRQDNLDKVLKDNLKPYGRKLRSLKYETRSLSEILLDNNSSNAEKELNHIKDTLQKIIEYKKKRLKTSINSNKFPFKLKENGTLWPNTKKGEWLYSFIEKEPDDVYKKLEEYARQFNYESFVSKLGESLVSASAEDPRQLAKTAEAVFQEYYKEEKNKHPNVSNYDFYLREVRAYIKHFFPIKVGKNVGASKRQKALANPKRLDGRCSAKNMEEHVRHGILNQLTALLIQHGKIVHYYKGKEDLTSNDLQKIQVEEAFKKQILSSVAFATSRLNYITDYYGESYEHQKSRSLNFFKPDIRTNGNSNPSGGDILSSKNTYYNDYLKNLKLQPDKSVNFLEKISSFLPIEFDANKPLRLPFEYPTTDLLPEQILLEEIKESINAVRNNIFHFKSGNFTQLIKKETQGDLKLKDSFGLSKAYLKYTVSQINISFSKRIESMNLPLYYSNEVIGKILNKLTFQLYPRQYSMTPSFKKIFQRGILIQIHYKNSKPFSWFVSFNKIEENQAFKNLLQLIYQHGFLSEVFKNDKIVLNCIDKVIDINKKETSTNSKNKHQYGYKFIDDFRKKNSIQNLDVFLQSLQAAISKIEDDILETGSEDVNYVQQFIQDLYAYAFHNYLEKNLKLHFEDIMHPLKQNLQEVEATLDKLKQIDIHTAFSCHNTLEELAPLYLFFALLDSSEINRLQQQFSRYRIAMKNEVHFNDIEDYAYNIEELLELVDFTGPDPKFTALWRNKSAENFSPFIEGNMPCYDNFYLSSDQNTPIYHRSMGMLNRSGVMGLYRIIFADSKRYRITKADYQIYTTQQNEEDGYKKIESLHIKANELHETIIKKANTAQYIEGEFERYKKYIKEIYTYNFAKQTLTFETLYKVFQIHMEVLSRLIGFAEDWERDTFAYLTAIEDLKGNIVEPGNTLNKLFDRGNVIGKLKGKLNQAGKAYLKLFYRDKDLLNDIDIRNYIAHLNHLTQFSKDNTPAHSLIETINETRKLVSYDDKRQNAVTKAIIDIFKKNNLTLVFNRSNNSLQSFCIRSIQPVKIQHLKKVDGANKHQLFFPVRSELLASSLKTLMEYKHIKKK